MVERVTVTDAGTIPLTDGIRDTLGWRPGDRLTVEMDGYAVKFRLDAAPGMMSTEAVTFSPRATPAPEPEDDADTDAVAAEPAARPAAMVDRLIADRLAEIRAGEQA